VFGPEIDGFQSILRDPVTGKGSCVWAENRWFFEYSQRPLILYIVVNKIKNRKWGRRVWARNRWFSEHSARPRYREGGRVFGPKIDGFSSILSDPWFCILLLIK